VGIVEALDVVEPRQPRHVSRRERPLGKQFAFEGGKETLRHCVIKAVAPTPHRGRHPRFAESSPEGEARVLASLIRVVDHSGRSSLPERHFDRLND